MRQHLVFKVCCANRLHCVVVLTGLIVVAGSATNIQAQCQQRSGGTSTSSDVAGTGVANSGRVSGMGGMNNFNPVTGVSSGFNLFGTETLQSGVPDVPVSASFQRKLMIGQQRMAERYAAARERNSTRIANASTNKSKISKPKKLAKQPTA